MEEPLLAAHLILYFDALAVKYASAIVYDNWPGYVFVLPNSDPA